jgi:hypothetical protein
MIKMSEEMVDELYDLRLEADILAARMAYRHGEMFDRVLRNLRTKPGDKDLILDALSNEAHMNKKDVVRCIAFTNAYPINKCPALALLGKELLVRSLRLLRKGETFEDLCDREDVELPDSEDDRKRVFRIRMLLTNRLKKRDAKNQNGDHRGR